MSYTYQTGMATDPRKLYIGTTEKYASAGFVVTNDEREVQSTTKITRVGIGSLDQLQEFVQNYNDFIDSQDEISPLDSRAIMGIELRSKDIVKEDGSKTKISVLTIGLITMQDRELKGKKIASLDLSRVDFATISKIMEFVRKFNNGAEESIYISSLRYAQENGLSELVEKVQEKGIGFFFM